MAGIVGHLRQLVRLRTRLPVPRPAVRAGASTKALRKASPAASLASAPLLAGTVDPVGGQPLHRCVVEQIGCRDGGQLESSEGDVGVHVVREECLDGAAQRRHGRRVPACHPCGAALEQQVGGRVRRVPRGWQARAPSARSPAGGWCWMPTRRRRWPPGRTAACPSRHAGRAAPVALPRRPARQAASATCPRGNWIRPSSWVACAVRPRIAQAPGGLGQQGVGSVDRPREHVGLRLPTAVARPAAPRSGVSSAARSRSAAAAA